MTTPQRWKDAAHVLRASITPVLALTAAAVSLQLVDPWPPPDVLPAAVLSITAGWLLLTVTWAATRPFRDRRASQQLVGLRTALHAPNRALVHIHAIVRESLAGQLMDVVNVETGHTHRIWIAETSLPVGSFSILERSNDAVAVVHWIPRRTVEAARRSEARTSVPAVREWNSPGLGREHSSSIELLRITG